MTNRTGELQFLRSHMDCRFTELATAVNILHRELRADFQAQLHEAVEKLNARIEAQTRWIPGTQVAILLAIAALVANS
jgi:hypothetical protein